METIIIRSVDALHRSGNLQWTLWEEYERAFPYDERRSRESILARLDEADGGFYILLFRDGEGELSAFSMLHDLGTLVYIEYLCVPAHKRSGGLGSRVLDAIRAHTPHPLVLEAEPAGTNEWAERRLYFYKRNGFELLDIPYLQPAYHDDSLPVDMSLLISAPIDRPDTLPHLLHTVVYRVDPSTLRPL